MIELALNYLKMDFADWKDLYKDYHSNTCKKQVVNLGRIKNQDDKLVAPECKWFYHPTPCGSTIPPSCGSTIPLPDP